MEAGPADEGNPLLGIELNAEQVELLRTVLYRVTTKTARAENATWPCWQSIRGALRQKGYDAARTARSLPTIAKWARWPYSTFWRSDFGDGDFRPTETVGLTIAGLHLVDPARSDRLVQLIAQFGDLEVARDYSDDDGEPEIVSFNHEVEDGHYLDINPRRAGDVGAMSIRAAADLLRHEYDTIVDEPRPGVYEVRLGPGVLSNYANLDNAGAYLSIVVDRARAADAVRPPRVPLGYTTPTASSIHIENYTQHGGNAAFQSEINTQQSATPSDRCSPKRGRERNAGDAMARVVCTPGRGRRHEGSGWPAGQCSVERHDQVGTGCDRRTQNHNRRTAPPRLPAHQG